MDVRIFSSFVLSAISILEQVAQVKGQLTQPSVSDRISPSYDVSVRVSIVGDVEGTVVYSMDQDVAKKIASTMLMGALIKELDDISLSAITELANMITGNASTKLASKGLSVDITPPTLLSENHTDIPFGNTQTVIIPIKTDTGIFEINAALQESY